MRTKMIDLLVKSYMVAGTDPDEQFTNKQIEKMSDERLLKVLKGECLSTVDKDFDLSESPANNKFSNDDTLLMKVLKIFIPKGIKPIKPEKSPGNAGDKYERIDALFAALQTGGTKLEICKKSDEYYVKFGEKKTAAKTSAEAMFRYGIGLVALFGNLEITGKGKGMIYKTIIPVKIDENTGYPVTETETETE